MMADRRIHAVTAYGTEVVRYDRAGKWFMENAVEGWKHQIRITDAVSLALQEGSILRLGVPGGSTFDARVRTRLDGELDR